MKKYFLLTIIACLATIFSSQAQLRFGVKAGANISGVTTSGGDFIESNVTGFQVGPSIEWLIHGNLGFDAAAVYSQKGINFKNGTGENKETTGYIEIPVNLKYRLGLVENFKPYITAGPYINFKVSGDDTFKNTFNNIQNDWEAKNFGAGLNFGAGVELFKFLQVGANYGIGLTDNYEASNGNYSTKDRTWSVTAAIYF